MKKIRSLSFALGLSIIVCASAGVVGLAVLIAKQPFSTSNFVQKENFSNLLQQAQEVKTLYALTSYLENEKGFVQLIKDAFEELNVKNLTYSEAKAIAWYQSNISKAHQVIREVNAAMRQRGLGNFFGGLFKMFGGALATAFTFGQVPATINYIHQGVAQFTKDPNFPDDPDPGTQLAYCAAKIGVNFIPATSYAGINSVGTAAGLAGTSC